MTKEGGNIFAWELYIISVVEHVSLFLGPKVKVASIYFLALRTPPYGKHHTSREIGLRITYMALIN